MLSGDAVVAHRLGLPGYKGRSDLAKGKRILGENWDA